MHAASEYSHSYIAQDLHDEPQLIVNRNYPNFLYLDQNINRSQHLGKITSGQGHATNDVYYILRGTSMVRVF